ncbi:hypothetical protein [Sporisorium scitamineum]|uniref:Uncharacterized protein n=1 Tax=Sporisorium scitamineum TaxID=49012 RepID=A0A0F7S1Y4_9BASI|nr:hypothetical protein [Sporisorium scitamineum]
MFEKLNEIISSETIYYTRKYTEERHRIFQLLIDNYGDMGIKGNFLRGRTAAALISRVAGVLRTARERGEKIKQPFKFFFPNKKDDDVAPRSATAPVASAASISNGRNRAAPRQNGDATQAKGKGKGKAKGKQKVQRQTHGNPPEIRKRTANAASAPPTSSPAHRGAKRPANGQATTTTPPHSKKQRAPNKQPRPPIASTRPTQQRQDTSADRSQGDRTARQPSHRAALSSRRSRSTSPRPSDDQNYSNRPRGRSPRRGGDSWIHEVAAALLSRAFSLHPARATQMGAHIFTKCKCKFAEQSDDA